MAERSPEAVAVSCGDRRLTYRELGERSDRLASALAGRDVEAGTLVGVCLEPSMDLLVAFLGILKAGAAFVPLDPLEAPERLAFMVEDSGLSVVVASAAHAYRFRPLAAEPLALDGEDTPTEPPHRGELAAPPDEDRAACLLYTSGSSGEPKGVLLGHRGLLNHLEWVDGALLRDAVDHLPLVTNLTFAASLKQLFAPLLRGAAVWALPREVATAPAALLEAISGRARVGVNCVPSLWAAVLDALEAGEAIHPGERLTGLFFSGEAPSRHLVERTFAAFPHLEVWNMYGATETTGTSIACRLRPGEDVPIGRPISGMRAHVLDDRGRQVAEGAAGELFLAGDGLALGYWRRPALTAEAFVEDDSGAWPEARLYRTGDLVRLRPDGDLEFVSRRGRRIKVRGVSVEPREVEEALNRHPAVQLSVVTGMDEREGAERLVAYVVPLTGQRPSVAELRRHLRGAVSMSMLPSAVVVLDSLPLTHTGKVDHAALPTPGPAARSHDGRGAPHDVGGGPGTSPRTRTERELGALWERMLEVRPVGVDEDFFDLGGDSLLAVRMLAEANRLLGREVSLAAFFADPTIQGLVRSGERGAALTRRSLVPLQEQGSRRPFFFVTPTSGNLLGLRELARQLGPNQPFYALVPQGLDGASAPHTSVEEMAGQYLEEVRQVQPHGPYLLGGHCYGGRVALEMARRLDEDSEQTALLALVEAPAELLPSHRTAIEAVTLGAPRGTLGSRGHFGGGSPAGGAGGKPPKHGAHAARGEAAADSIAVPVGASRRVAPGSAPRRAEGSISCRGISSWVPGPLRSTLRVGRRIERAVRRRARRGRKAVVRARRRALRRARWVMNRSRLLSRRVRIAWMAAWWRITWEWELLVRSPGREERRRRRTVEWTALEAHRAFEGRRYRGRAVLFLTEESLPWLPGWSELAESVELELVPGRHFTVTREPHVRALAERVKARAEAAEARG